MKINIFLVIMISCTICTPSPEQFEKLDPKKLEKFYTIFQEQHNTIVELTNNLVRQNKILENIERHISSTHEALQDYKNNFSTKIATGLFSTLLWSGALYITYNILVNIFTLISTLLENRKIISEKDIESFIETITEKLKEHNIDITNNLLNNELFSIAKNNEDKKNLIKKLYSKENIQNIIEESKENKKKLDILIKYNNNISEDAKNNIIKNFTLNFFVIQKIKEEFKSVFCLEKTNFIDKSIIINNLYDQYIVLYKLKLTNMIKTISVLDHRGIILKQNYDTLDSNEIDKRVLDDLIKIYTEFTIAESTYLVLNTRKYNHNTLGCLLTLNAHADTIPLQSSAQPIIENNNIISNTAVEKLIENIKLESLNKQIEQHKNSYRERKNYDSTKKQEYKHIKHKWKLIDSILQITNEMNGSILNSILTEDTYFTKNVSGQQIAEDNTQMVKEPEL
jgi:hypothetical protein